MTLPILLEVRPVFCSGCLQIASVLPGTQSQSIATMRHRRAGRLRVRLESQRQSLRERDFLMRTSEPGNRICKPAREPVASQFRPPEGTKPADYLDNVALADQSLGAVRRAMEAAGQWDRTAVIISADHGWRTYLWRGDPDWSSGEEAASHGRTMGVPFLVKLPNQTVEFPYESRFDTVLTRRIIEGILAGRLRAAVQLANEIDAAR